MALLSRRSLLCSLLVAGPAGRASAQSADRESARERWQRVPDLIVAMKANTGSTVADVGAGSGFLSVRLAAAVGPSGRVYAVDIVPDVVRRLRERVDAAGLRNVDVVEGTASDPRLPAATLDAVVMVNAYHEVTDAAVVLAHFRQALKPKGRLVLCEPRPRMAGGSRAEQVTRHVIAPEFVVDEITAAGFVMVSRDDDFTANPSGTEPSPYALVVAERP